MDLKRIFRGWVLAILLVFVLLVVVLKVVGSGQTYQSAPTSEVVKLVDTGAIKSAILNDNTQIIQIVTKNGQALQATWVGNQGQQLTQTMDRQVATGALPLDVIRPITRRATRC